MTAEEFKAEYELAKTEAREWKREYPSFERLANNELPDDLDDNEPEANDGSLAAALFKWPKRVVPKDLTGTFKALDRNDKWVNEYAKIEYTKNILPYANTQATPRRKWIDAVRKSATFGSVPIITLLTEVNKKIVADFIVAYPTDVCMQPGKVSDNDSDYFYWDVYFSDTDIDNLIEAYDNEVKEAKEEGRKAYNTWSRKGLVALKDATEEDRDVRDTPKSVQNKPVKKGGKKVVLRLARGVGAKFIAYAPAIDMIVREFDNPDPTGDPGVHYLYCYQDFINPYGIGIVKLAGGTQNVLDFLRRADVLATQIGIRPPISVGGDLSQTDLSTIVNGQDALWIVGNAQIQRQNLANGIYSELPNRISMYKTSLNQLIPVGDTSISATAGDPNYSKTPAGVKFQQQSLSIDDEDMTENLMQTFEAVTRSQINVHFANKNGVDIVTLSESERKRIFDSAPELFPQFQEQVDPETGETLAPSEELEVIWDNARANFDFSVDAEPDKTTDKEQRLEGAMRVLELVNADRNFVNEIQLAGKKFNKGELLADIIGMLTDNEKIITDISADEQGEMQQQALEQEQAMQQPQQPQMQQPQMQQDDPDQKIQAVMEAYGVDDETAAMVLDAEYKGLGSVDEIMQQMRAA